MNKIKTNFPFHLNNRVYKGFDTKFRDKTSIQNILNQPVKNELKDSRKCGVIHIEPSSWKSGPIIYLHAPKRLLPNGFFNQHSLHGRWAQLRHLLIYLYLLILPIWIDFCLILTFIMWLPIKAKITEDDIKPSTPLLSISEEVATSTTTPWGSIIATFALFTITYLLIGDPFSLKIIPNFIRDITYPLHSNTITQTSQEQLNRIGELREETIRYLNERNVALEKCKELSGELNNVDKILAKFEDETFLINKLKEDGERVFRELNTVNIKYEELNWAFNTSLETIEKIKKYLENIGHNFDGRCPPGEWIEKYAELINQLHERILNSGGQPTQLDLTLANDLSVAISELSINFPLN